MALQKVRRKKHPTTRRARGRSKQKRRGIGKIWRRAFLWRSFRNFLSLLASAEIFCVFAIDSRFAASQSSVRNGQFGVRINRQLRNLSGVGNMESKFDVLRFGSADVYLGDFCGKILLRDLMPLRAGGGQFRIRSKDGDSANCALVDKRDHIEVLDLRKREHKFAISIRQSVTKCRVVGDESHLGEVVVDSGTDAEARDISRVNRRFFGGDDFAGEKLEATGEKNSASDSADTGKPREVRAHNFHSYKKDNTSAAGFLAIQILAVYKNFCA